MKKALIISTVSRQFYLFEKVNIDVLRKLGYEVHGAANFADRSERLKEIDIIEHELCFSRNPFSFSNIKAFVKLLSLLRENNFELIHAHSPVGGVYGRIAAKLSGVPKVFYTAHGFHFYKGAPIFNWMLFYPLEKLLSRLTDTLITINKEDFEIANKNFFMRNLELVDGIGINYKKFHPETPEIKMKLRDKFKLDRDSQILIYVGELSHRKNQQVLLEAMLNMQEKNQQIKLLLVGKGNLKEEYEKFIFENNLSKSVYLLGFRDDIPQLMQIADIAISSSKQEGLPVNLMEAMGTGLPLIVSNCRGNRDLLKDNGIVIKDNTSIQWSDAIIELFNSPNRLNEYGLRSLELSKRFSEEKIRVKMTTIYSVL
ncbi:glycosyltransferase family 4 protein [Streptococcus suis]|nr:glycosyltransferase family 4 protein [Streptococcus suis]